MKRYNNYKSTKLFHAVLRSIIFILSICLIMKCISYFGTGIINESTQSLKSNAVSAACNYMIQSNIPILNYIAYSDEGENNNIILSTMVGSFPINQYVSAAIDDTEDNLIESDEKSTPLLFANGLNAIINNMQEKNNTYNEDDTGSSTEDDSNSGNNLGIMPIDIISGEVYLEQEDPTDESTEIDSQQTLGSINGEYFTLDQLLNRQFLYNNFYIIDSATVVDDDLFDAKVLLDKDMTMKQDSDKPQILIYHTHSQEAYVDSKAGVEADTIVGVGTYLTKLLTEKYGYNVIHDKSKYDLMEGYLERNLAYNHAADGIEEILEDNPSIEVVIDLHRDGVSEDLPQGQGKRIAKINGKSTAQLMLFNGLSRNAKGEITRLKNPYLQDNLAFSLQVQLKGREMYSGLMYKNYLHAYRYNFHFRKKTLLVETGTNRNTVQEAMNAMDLLADILNDVLTEK